MRDQPVLTQFVLDWLGQSQEPRVLHVFERACNLINEGDEIVSLVWPELGAGPFALVLPEKRPFTAIRTDTKVNLADGVFVLGDFNLNYKKAIIWQSRLDWESIQQSQTSWPKILPRLQQILVDDAPMQTAVFQPKINSAQKELLTGMQTNNRHKIENGAKQLAGLGQGLTPTGDDFLLGTIIALWTTGYDVAVIDLIVQTAVPRTTTFSGAWLQAAGRGELVQSWHDFFAGLEDGGWETAVYKILQIGHSSGYDALLGFTAVMETGN